MARTPLDVAWETVPKLVASGRPVGECMHELALLCQEADAREGWGRFQSIDYDTSVEALRRWIQDALEETPPPLPLFGLFLPLVSFSDEKSPRKSAERLPCYTAFRLTGTGARPPPGSKGWIGPQDYTPRRQYGHAPAFLEISRIADEDDSSDMDYVMPLGFGVLAVGAIFAPHTTALINPDADEIPIVAGWEDGDFYEIGQLTRSGFRAEASAHL